MYSNANKQHHRQQQQTEAEPSPSLSRPQCSSARRAGGSQPGRARCGTSSAIFLLMDKAGHAGGRDGKGACFTTHRAASPGAPPNSKIIWSSNLGSSKLGQQGQAKSQSGKQDTSETPQKRHSGSWNRGVFRQAGTAGPQCRKKCQSSCRGMAGLGSSSPAPERGLERLPWRGKGPWVSPEASEQMLKGPPLVR